MKSRKNYWKEWYSNPENRKKHIAQSRKHAKVRKAKLLDLIRAAKSKPCTDCKEEYPPYVMQFDHLPERGKKLMNVAKLRGGGYSERKILAEIAKCEVVCSNCHAERTHRRQKGSPLGRG